MTQGSQFASYITVGKDSGQLYALIGDFNIALRGSQVKRIVGNYCIVASNDTLVYGRHNIVLGRGCRVQGQGNFIVADIDCFVAGSKNHWFKPGPSLVNLPVLKFLQARGLLQPCLDAVIVVDYPVFLTLDTPKEQKEMDVLDPDACPYCYAAPKTGSLALPCQHPLACIQCLQEEKPSTCTECGEEVMVVIPFHAKVIH